MSKSFNAAVPHTEAIMKTLLQLNTSLFSGQGQSTQLADQFVARWRDKNPDGRVITRDLAADPAPHLDGARFQSFLTAPESRTAAQNVVVAYSDALIEELRAADIVVLGLPMYFAIARRSSASTPKTDQMDEFHRS